MCCRNSCWYISIIVGILAGVILGILFALGFIAINIIFWAYLLVGVLGVLLAPIYSSVSRNCNLCFCGLKTLILTAALGSIITSAIGLIVAAITSVTVIAIVLGLATLFTVMLIVAAVCLTNCLCFDN